MNFKTIIYRKNEGIAEIILNRPDKMNAMSFETIRECLTAVADVSSDDTVGVLVIKGAGPKAFTSGDDVRDKEWLEVGFNWTPGEMFTGLREKHFYELLDVLRSLRKPVIAAVHGWCLASGCELAMACDIIIASDEARFGLPFINIGVISGTALLPRVVGYHKACELLFTGDHISAKEAEAMGLVNRVVPSEQLQDAVDELARKLSKQPTQLVGWAKWALNRAMECSFKEALEYEVIGCALTHPSKFVPRLVERQAGMVYSKK
jgi:enoyl-CoA hydratase/carnithine racemase